MRKILVTAVLLAFMPAVAWAFGDQGQAQGQGQLQGQGQAQGQLQGQQQGQGQGQAQIGINKNANLNLNGAAALNKGVKSKAGASNKTAINIEGDDIDPPAYAPGLAVFNPTAKCKVPLSGTGGFLGIVSLGGSGAITDENCEWIEKAKACTQGMVAFPDMKDTCEEIWRLAMMSEAERDAAIAKKETAKLAGPKRVAVGPHTQHFQDDAGKVYKIHFENGVRGGLTPVAKVPDNVTFDRDDRVAFKPTE